MVEAAAVETVEAMAEEMAVVTVEETGGGRSGKANSSGGNARGNSTGAGGGAAAGSGASGVGVRHADGMSEVIDGGRYIMKDARGRTIINRRATLADLKRIQSLIH
ncbi:hypothetical protein [Ensifer canadensis]